MASYRKNKKKRKSDLKPEAHINIKISLQYRHFRGHVSHLGADGAAALARTGVKVEVKEHTGVTYFQVWVSVNTRFQTLKPTKDH